MKKSELYTNERQMILEKLLEILNITEENNTFFLYEIDSDEKKQNQILELEKDIKKYFVCCNWACFFCPDVKRKALSIIKNIMRAMKYKMISKRKLMKLENSETKRQETFYYLIK